MQVTVRYGHFYANEFNQDVLEILVSCIAAKLTKAKDMKSKFYYLKKGLVKRNAQVNSLFLTNRRLWTRLKLFKSRSTQRPRSQSENFVT